MTEDDTFLKLRRKNMREIHREWIESPLGGWDSEEVAKWFEDRNWNREEFYRAWMAQ